MVWETIVCHKAHLRNLLCASHNRKTPFNIHQLIHHYVMEEYVNPQQGNVFVNLDAIP